MPPSSSPQQLLALALLLAACRPSVPPTGPELLAAAQRAMGTTDSINTLWTVASVTSPSGGFETRIASARSGEVRLALGRSLTGGNHDSQGWSCDSARAITSLDPINLSVSGPRRAARSWTARKTSTIEGYLIRRNQT